MHSLLLILCSLGNKGDKVKDKSYTGEDLNNSTMYDNIPAAGKEYRSLYFQQSPVPDSDHKWDYKYACCFSMLVLMLAFQYILQEEELVCGAGEGRGGAARKSRSRVDKNK